MNAFLRNHRKILKYGYSYCQNTCKLHRYDVNTFARYRLYHGMAKLNPTPLTSQCLLNRPLMQKSIVFTPMLNIVFDRSLSQNYLFSSLRSLSTTPIMHENVSKVESTVNCLKEKQKEKEKEKQKEIDKAKEAADVGGAPKPIETPNVLTAATEKSEKAVAEKKKPLGTRIWEELVHYYHGFRLLFIDMSICIKLVWRILNGKTLTRRENNLLVRTTSDFFRLIPFSLFIIVPFLEFTLPLFLKFFPGMLPSTFQTAEQREDKLKRSLQAKLEIAKFLQQTLENMSVENKNPKSGDAGKDFAEFYRKIRDPKEYVSNEEIIKFSKRFDDEITLDSMSLDQLSALCRLLELNTMGTSNLLKFQLRVKLRSLRADDRVIAREGVDSLDLFELQQACKARGMRAYGLTAQRLRSQLQEWISLSLNEKVPPTLLLLSRAMLIPDEAATTDKLKETLRVLPDALGTQTKAAICEAEGKIDNKTRIEVIKEEERKIKEEREEECEEEKFKSEVLVDKAGTIGAAPSEEHPPTVKDTIIDKIDEVVCEPPTDEKSISSKDVNVLSEALKALSSDKKMVVEKETIKDIKEDLEEYKEDLNELREVREIVSEPIHESRAAKILYKKVNDMLCQLDTVLCDLEKKQQLIQETCAKRSEVTPEEALLQRKEAELVHIDELMKIIRKLQQTTDESRLKQIEVILSKIDGDKDGVITVDEVLNVVQALGRENVHLNEQQIEDLIVLLDKEQLLETEKKIEKAIAKSIKEAEIILAKKESEMEQLDLDNIVCPKKPGISDKLKDTAIELKDTAPELEDKAKNIDEKASGKTEGKDDCINEYYTDAAEAQKEKIVPTKSDISTVLPPPIPPPPTTSSSPKGKPKDKMI